MEGKSLIIVKRPKKGAHGGAHGGSWKVAYADFVTALMAFFLLMWLVTMVSPEKRARVANYFKHFAIFEKGGKSFLEHKPGMQIMNDLMEEDAGASSGQGVEEGGSGEALSGEKQFRERFERDMATLLADLKDQVLVRAFDGGVRIELTDKTGSPMFLSGRSDLTPQARKVLQVIAQDIRGTTVRIAVEGHTDAAGNAYGAATNWELSTLRASAARRELERAGFDPARFGMVAGYAATRPLVREDPMDARNRRVSLVLFFKPVGGRVPSADDPSPDLFQLLSNPRGR